jgi:aryl-alcohol dehydrogenase-like predicted oxidoreductase
MSNSAQIERRPVAGASVETSALGLVVDPSPSAPPSADRLLVAQLQKARKLGFTTYDIATARSPARAVRLLTAAFGEHDPDLLTVFGPPTLAARSPSSRSRAPPRLGTVGPEADFSASIMEFSFPLKRLGSVIVDWDPTSSTPASGEEFAGVLNQLVESHAIDNWSLRLQPGADLPTPTRSDPRRPVSVELSLLEHRQLEPLAKRYQTTRGAVLVRNPFADGRLDGTRFSATLADRRPRSTPVDLRSLSAEFAPVLALAPLTRSHRRTLAQAAIQYVVRWPWVASVLLPLPSPERWDELCAALNAPSLEDDELRAAGLLADSRDPPPSRAA